MKRRRFINEVGAGAFAMMISGTSSRAAGAPQMAITIDDPATSATPRLRAEERNRAILSALGRHNLKAALFVCGMRVDSDAGQRILNEWDKSGHLIGNHSYSHLYYHSSKISTEAFIQDIERCEPVINKLARFRKLFRFPFLKEGNTAEKRDRARAFLKERGYRTGHVTIDASDWYVDDRLEKRLVKEPDADAAPYKNFYLKHIWDRAVFYDELARKAIGRSVKHTLLVHHNLLNALFLDDLLSMFKKKGWQLINAEDAFKDEIFSLAPDILPAGESIIWAAAKATGKLDSLLRYPGEDSRYEKAEMDRLGL